MGDVYFPGLCLPAFTLGILLTPFGALPRFPVLWCGFMLLWLTSSGKAPSCVHQIVMGYQVTEAHDLTLRLQSNKRLAYK